MQNEAEITVKHNQCESVRDRTSDISSKEQHGHRYEFHVTGVHFFDMA